MTTAEKLTVIAENQPKIYEKGKTDELDEFWENMQEGGKRKDYQCFCSGWSGVMAPFFKPKYDVSVHDSAAYVLYCNQIEFDYAAAGIDFDFTNATNLYGALNTCAATAFGTINFGETSVSNVLTHCYKLKSIDNLIINDKGGAVTSGSLRQLPLLEDIKITGTIASTIDMHVATKLTTESILSILTALSKDSTLATGKTFTMPTAAQTKIDADSAAKSQYNQAIAAGWTIAFA